MQTNKIKNIIIILLILFVVTIVAGVTVYFTTDLLKPKEMLFKKYIAQNIINVADIFDISSETEIIDLLRNKDYTEETNISLKYLENENDKQEEYNISENGVINNSSKASYRKIDTTYGNEKLLSAEVLKEEDTFGIRLSSLVQQFVSVKNSSLSYLLASIGYNKPYLCENLQGVDISGLLNFSDEEIKELQSKYTDAIFVDINSSNYSSKGNALITLNNGQSINTKSYTLSMSKNEWDKIYKRVLTQAVEDQIILSKITEIDNKIKEAGIEEKDGKTLKDQYVQKLQTIADNIEYAGENSSKIAVTVYQSKGITYRTLIKTEKLEISIDLDNTEGKALSLKLEELTDEGSNIYIYKLGKEKTPEGVKNNFSYVDDKQKFKTTISSTKNENQLVINANLDYISQHITCLNVESTSNVSLNSVGNIPVKFEDNNNILLNDFEGDRIIAIIENLENRLIKSLENSQSKINTKLLNNILVWADNKQKEEASKEQENEEQQKQRFNNQFILYQGEDLKSEHVKKLLKIIGKNMSDYNVVSGNKIKITIEKGTNNEDKANEIANAISEEYTYNVQIEYSEDGLVNAINISIYEEDEE